MPFHISLPRETVLKSLFYPATERTFWEKATILHQECHRPKGKPLPLRLSRHYYDLFCLLGSDQGKRATQDLGLLKLVVAHKKIFFRSGWAKYNQAVSGTLRIVPSSARIRELESDYQKMGEHVLQGTTFV